MVDNLNAYKGEKVRQLVENRGSELLYPPPYSPNLNPIEEAFSKIKAFCAGSKPAATKPWLKR